MAWVTTTGGIACLLMGTLPLLNLWFLRPQPSAPIPGHITQLLFCLNMAGLVSLGSAYSFAKRNAIVGFLLMGVCWLLLAFAIPDR